MHARVFGEGVVVVQDEKKVFRDRGKDLVGQSGGKDAELALDLAADGLQQSHGAMAK